jgi:peptide-methionine (S)-S-oxide reductase
MPDMKMRPEHDPAPTRRGVALLSGALAAAAGFAWLVARSSAAAPRAVAAPKLDPASASNAEAALLAGGCFWGVQGVFQHVEGVASAVSGYAGGDKSKANYEDVTTGATGHAETVKVVFDPRAVSFGRILQIFFSVAHDPTQLNRQGPDEGPQYRSAIFPTSAEQARIAKAYIAQLDQARAYASPIVTQIEPGREFFAAEDYHQDFVTKHPTHPYIAYHDLPKLESLKRLFPDRYRVRPALVSGSSQ